MNLFGPELKKVLERNKIGKAEFSGSCGLHRNQLTNIITGRAKNPHKIEQIFATLAGLIPHNELRDLGIYYLEDRRSDIGFCSSEITLRRSDESIANEPKRKLLSLYEAESDFRGAIDSIVELILAGESNQEQNADAYAKHPQLPPWHDLGACGESTKDPPFALAGVAESMTVQALDEFHMSHAPVTQRPEPESRGEPKKPQKRGRAASRHLYRRPKNAKPQTDA